jgi:hypothetical protein
MGGERDPSLAVVAGLGTLRKAVTRRVDARDGPPLH